MKMSKGTDARDGTPGQKLGRRSGTKVATKTIAEKTAGSAGDARLTRDEERVMRLIHGTGAEDDAPLAPKTTQPELLAKLRDIEAQLFMKFGQLEPMSKKQQIINKIRAKKA